MADRVLFTTDDLEHAVRINAHLETAGFHTTLVSSFDDVRRAVGGAGGADGSDAAPAPDCIVLTGGLHESSAAQLLRIAHDRSISTLGLVESTEPDPKEAARRLGLTSFLVKPADPTEVSATVLRQGESGTGKELVAHAIHDLSPRRVKPFIALNCAAIPETLLESELFGHEKGAFTGAAERRLGRFELAEGGTIFLDEVGEMAPATQVKTLRVLEDRSFFRVGGTQAIKVDVRVIAATNKSLKEEVALARFRDDLFYRLNVLHIYLPPLRERKTDIPLLVRRFIAEFAKQHDRTFRGITPEALQILVDAEWPGNIRQLRNLIESMVVLAPEGEIRASDIPKDIREHGSILPMRLLGPDRDVGGAGAGAGARELEFIFRSLVELKLQVEELRRRLEERPGRVEVIEVGPGTGVSAVTPGQVEPAPEADVVYRPGMTMADVERAAIEAALRDTQGNRRKAAEILGIGERTLYRKLKAYALA